MREQRKFILAAGWRVAGKSYRRVLEVGGRAAWWLGLPDCPVFPAPLANYDWRRFDQPQAGVARNKNITEETRPSKMEIYHRDNWIIIVHMATWKDLTKWNEENTTMDWINYIGRMVKRVFAVPSRLQREGRASEKD